MNAYTLSARLSRNAADIVSPSITLNLDHLAATDVRGFSLNGADMQPSQATGGDGGRLTINTANDLNPGADIDASTGINGASGAFGGAGGSVALTSTGGAVTVDHNITVSSSDPAPMGSPAPGGQRRSASGGNVTLRTKRTSGTGITVANTSQILALLSAGVPGPGGKIEFASAGANIVVSGSGTGGTGMVQADRGTILIHNDGDLVTSGSANTGGLVTLNGAILNADIIKVGALGVNGQLTITAGSRISAGSLLNLYAGNGQAGADLVHFTGAGSIYLNGSQINIAASTVTVDSNTTVVNTGATDIYATQHIYQPTPVSVGGGFMNSFTQHPLSARPGF